LYQDLAYCAEREKVHNYTNEKIDDMTLVSRALILHRTSPPSSPTTYLELKTAWGDASYNWTESAGCRDLTTILAKSISIPSANKIVCFGLGGLSDPSAGPEGLVKLARGDGLPRRAAMTQHAAAITMAAVLGKRFGTDPLPIIVQDPDYTLADKKLLAEVGIEVVDGCGSLAFTHVDDKSVVLSIHPNIPVKQVVADIARPAVMIWNRVQPVEEEKTEYKIDLWQGVEVISS
jgi:hypothetical protein